MGFKNLGFYDFYKKPRNLKSPNFRFLKRKTFKNPDM